MACAGKHPRVKGCIHANNAPRVSRKSKVILGSGRLQYGLHSRLVDYLKLLLFWDGGSDVTLQAQTFSDRTECTALA